MRCSDGVITFTRAIGNTMVITTDVQCIIGESYSIARKKEEGKNEGNKKEIRS